MASLERRVSDLEVVLGEFLAQSALAARRAEAETHALKEDMRQFKQEMKDFKDEMKDFKDEMKDFKDEMKDFKDEMIAFKNKMERSTDDLNKRWGELSNKLGTVVEDIVAPNLPTIAKKYFGIASFDRIALNIQQKSHSSTKIKEFDLILVSGDIVLLNETKTTIRQNYLDDFIEGLSEFFDFFPEYQGKEVIPIFSSLKFSSSQINYLTKNRIYAMAMAGSTMDILNFSDFSRSPSS